MTAKMRELQLIDLPFNESLRISSIYCHPDNHPIYKNVLTAVLDLRGELVCTRIAKKLVKQIISSDNVGTFLTRYKALRVLEILEDGSAVHLRFEKRVDQSPTPISCFSVESVLELENIKNQVSVDIFLKHIAYFSIKQTYVFVTMLY